MIKDVWRIGFLMLGLESSWSIWLKILDILLMVQRSQTTIWHVKNPLNNGITINWCRVSSINSISGRHVVFFAPLTLSFPLAVCVDKLAVRSMAYPSASLQWPDGIDPSGWSKTKWKKHRGESRWLATPKRCFSLKGHSHILTNTWEWRFAIDPFRTVWMRSLAWLIFVWIESIERGTIESNGIVADSDSHRRFMAQPGKRIGPVASPPPSACMSLHHPTLHRRSHHLRLLQEKIWNQHEPALYRIRCFQLHETSEADWLLCRSLLS